MTEQDLLDFKGRDVFATAPYCVLDAVNETKRAVSLAHHAITGVKPQVAPGLDGLVGHVEVAIGKGIRFVRPQQQLTCLTRRQLDIVLVSDTRLKAGAQPAHHAGAGGVWRRGNHEIGFGGAKAFEQTHARALEKCLTRGRRHARPEACAHAVSALQRAGRLGQQDRDHRAQQVHHGGAMRVHGGPEPRSRKTNVKNHLAARQHGLRQGVERVDVKQRQGGAQHVSRANAQHVGAVHAPPVILRMRTHHPFGWAGGARGVENREGIARPHSRRWHGLARCRVRLHAHARAGQGCGSCVLPFRLVQNPDLLHRHDCAHLIGQALQKRRLDHQQPRLAVGQEIRYLRAHRGGIDGHHHGAQPAAGQKYF